MLVGRAAGSQAGSKVTNGQSRPASHTTVAHYLTWEPMGLPALPASAHRSAHARTLSCPPGSAIFFPTGVALHERVVGFY